MSATTQTLEYGPEEVALDAITSSEINVRLDADLRAAADELPDEEARYLVDLYYALQKVRVGAGNQVSALAKTREPNATLTWFHTLAKQMEGSIQSILDRYGKCHVMGPWLREIKGIGPVLTAGLLAYFDPERPTAGAWWRFAGMDPTATWGKGQKRPHCATAKVLAYKCGESFVKVQSRGSLYGELYVQKRRELAEQNEQGRFVDHAKGVIEAKRVGKATTTWKAAEKGGLCDGHMHARARRYAVKIFLAHLHDAWRDKLGLPVVAPYVIEHLGHSHEISWKDAR